MTQLRVAVVDDTESLSAGWAEEINAASSDVAAEPIALKELDLWISILARRRELARKEQPDDQALCRLDEIDVLIIDWDLAPRYMVTGADIAYLVRCYSECKFICVFNQFGDRFQLTANYQLDQFADLHIGVDQVGNPALWSGRVVGYRPWHWPIIPSAVATYSENVNRLSGNIDAPILTLLNLDEYIHHLSGEVADFIAPRADTGISTDISQMTVADFVRFGNGGIRRKDNVIDDFALTRIGASRLLRWLNLGVLPRQDILIDAPHLVRRFPSLLSGDRSNLDAWNATCQLPMAAKNAELRSQASQHEFAAGAWMWRPTWSLPSIEADESISEIRSPWDQEDPAFEFCEDLSRFLPTPVTRPYRVLIDSRFQRRSISNADSEHFEQQLERALPTGLDIKYDPSRIHYEPQHLLTA